MKALLVILGLVILAGDVAAEDGGFSSKYAVVMIDDATVAAVGAFPFDRSLYAQALDRCHEAHAKSVVLKFFFDQPRTEDGDEALAKSMRRIPTLLQARLDPAESNQTEIPHQFAFAAKAAASRQGDRGWIPLKRLMAGAAAVGFVDFVDENVPLVENYRGITYRSLVLSILENEFDQEADLSRAGHVGLAQRDLPVTALNVFQADISKVEMPKVYSFRELLAGRLEKESLQGKIVIIGYNRSTSPMVNSERESIPYHEFFVKCLIAVRNRLLSQR